MPRPIRRWSLIGVCATVLALFFLWWFVQTSWLGSFPGRETATYAFWAYVQLAAGVGLLAVAVAAFVRAGRSRGRL